MKKRHFDAFTSVLLASVLLATAVAALAGDGKLRLRVNPKEAYVFIDGSALGEGSGQFRVATGSHKVDVYNYGYQSESRTISVEGGKTVALNVVLQPLSGTVPGPWACITIKGAPRAAVLLNGKTPDYFVGHGDEFDNEWVWKQELLVPPGKHQITLVYGNQDFWSGTVEVAANQRVVIDAHKGGGVRQTVNWPRGTSLQSLPRFRAGIASATVAVGPAAAQFSANPAAINCGQSSQLTWSTSGVLSAQISGVSSIPASGQQAVQPKQTTTYKFTASGPGGVMESSTTVTVNNAVQASLDVSPAELRYRRVGDKVEEEGTATLNWSAVNADSISIDPLGVVSGSGTRTVQATPKRTDPGPVDETVTYKLTATNACGGAEERIAKLHVVGSIEPLHRVTVEETTLETKLAMNSIYFPTGLPSKRDPNGGLVRSQQVRLSEVAQNLKKYLEFRPAAQLTLQAHADQRGSSEFNLALSERRANRVKNFLMEQGVPATNLQIKPLGKEQNLDAEAVKRLTEENPNLAPEERKKVFGNLPTFLLANNRRVDIVLGTTGQQSTRFFPYNAEDLRVLLGEQIMGKRPARKSVKRK